MKQDNFLEGLASAIVPSTIFIVLFIILLATTIQATTSGSSDNVNLTISDITDNENRYSNLNVTFNANFTNTTADYLNESQGNALCKIRFDHTGAYGDYSNMTFNTTEFIWQYNETFDYKGTHQFQINCTSDYGNLTLNESFTILNTAPSINLDQGGSFIDFDGNPLNTDYLQCTEDSLCIYNFSANVTEIDANDVLTFGYSQTANTTLTNFTLNSTTGILEINYTNDDDIGSGDKKIELSVADTESPSINGLLRVNVTPVNDPPVFLNLGEDRMLNKSAFELILQASDEENDLNLTFNVTFLSCTHSAINPPTGPDNCTLFNLTDYNETATNISFTPLDNQKGEYEINFSVKDSRNATTSQVINWTLAWNDSPYFVSVCENGDATEDAEFNCYINASDPDELYNLTLAVNYTWFTFNDTQTNSTVFNVTLTEGNASALVNFTPTDIAVGNWSINVSVLDTGAFNTSAIMNSTIFDFYVRNVNDTVSIIDVPNKTVYTSSSYEIHVNATDDDLLIPDPNEYDENLTFMVNDSRVTLGSYSTTGNLTDVILSFDAGDFPTGNTTINVSVHDYGNNSMDSDLFTLEVFGNNEPTWVSGLQTTYVLEEDTAFYLNMSENVTDGDGDAYTFSYVINNEDGGNADFDNFGMTSGGVIDFTPADEDVGYWNITVTVTDGKTPVSREFNFTVTNIPDIPVIEQISTVNATPNPINDSDNDAFFDEDNVTTLYLRVLDDDHYIDSNQKSVSYSESLTVEVTIEGPNTTLISFPTSSRNVGAGQDNRVQWTNVLIPSKSDIGEYNVTINVTDSSGASDLLYFNLTVNEVQHNPVMTEIGNQAVSILNETLYIDVNATDEEDGDDGPSGLLNFSLINLTAEGDFLTINRSTGVINFTYNESYTGIWEYILVVNDTTNAGDTERFNVSVYDYPSIISPNLETQFNLVENVSSYLNFSANHSVQDDLTYQVYLNGVLRNTTSSSGDGTNVTLIVTPSFTDETTCTGTVNLTLNVSNAKLSNVTNWNLTVNHTNYPMSFTSTIDDQVGGTPVIVILSDHYSDIDAQDGCVNQTIGFTYTTVEDSESGGTITVTMTNWTNTTTPLASFAVGSTEGSANYSITGFEYNITNSSQALRSETSNNFSVTVTSNPNTEVVQSPGGGGGSRNRLISLKIIVPEPVSAKQRDRLVIPLGIVNDGTVDLKGILLSATIAKDGLLRNDLVASFDQSYFDQLRRGKRENVTLVVDIDTTSTGLFEVTINGTVRNPEYTDWAKFYIEIDEDETVLEKIIFTEEFIIGNPECAEYADLVQEARNLLLNGQTVLALDAVEGALAACEAAIKQPPRARVYERLGDSFLSYMAIASLAALMLGFSYYYYKRIKLRRQLRGY